MDYIDLFDSMTIELVFKLTEDVTFSKWCGELNTFFEFSISINFKISLFDCSVFVNTRSRS